MAYFAIWFALGTLIYLADEIERISGGLGFLFGLVLLLILLMVAPLAFLVGIFDCIWTHRWSRLAPIIGVPLLMYGFVAGAFRYQVDPDWIWFQVARPYYVEQAKNLAGPSPKYHQWYWGQTGGAGIANAFYFLVYDESDSPLAHREPPEWKNATGHARPYGHHFYLVSQTFN